MISFPYSLRLRFFCFNSLACVFVSVSAGVRPVISGLGSIEASTSRSSKQSERETDRRGVSPRLCVLRLFSTVFVLLLSLFYFIVSLGSLYPLPPSLFPRLFGATPSLPTLRHSFVLCPSSPLPRLTGERTRFLLVSSAASAPQGTQDPTDRETKQQQQEEEEGTYQTIVVEAHPRQSIS